MQEIPKEGLTYYEIRNFLTLSNEHLLIAKRQHWIILILPLILTIFMGIIFVPISYVILIIILQDILLFVAFLLTCFSLIITICIKQIIDWYFHLYIITTRRIIEVKCTPLFSDSISDVLLDQVRTTEIDVKMDDILHEFFNFGDVIIGFDRPSHEETFILKNIENPRETGMYVADTLEGMMYENPVWFRRKGKDNQSQYGEDVYKPKNKK